MANNRRDVELAIAVTTDMQQAHVDLRKLRTEIDGVSDSATEWGRSSRRAATMSAEALAAQEARLRAVVEAGMQQRAAADAVAEANRRSAVTAREAASNWQATASAQTALLNAHQQATRAAEQHAAQERQAAEAAAAAAAALQKQKQEVSSLLSSIDPLNAQLERLDELERRLAASRNAGIIDADAYQSYNTKLQAQRAALTGTAQATRMAGIGARQYQQAMRQLPMQITDITTSLATGMPIWLVAIQQGGQIRDSFGGWGNAARAAVSSINPLTAAVAAATAVVGGFFLAMEAGARDHTEFNKALITTGNYAGQTSASLDDLARSAAASGGLGRARDILTGLAASGRVGADSFEVVGRAAIAMAELTGKSSEQVVTEFARMTDDATRWAKETDRQYHFLDSSQLAQIDRLQEQGRTTEAVQLISEAFFESATERSKELRDNLTTLQSTWKGLGVGIKSAWEGIKDRATESAALFGAISKSVSELSDGDLLALLRKLERDAAQSLVEEERQVFTAAAEDVRKELAAREELARQKAEADAADERAGAAADRIAKRQLENLSKEERKQREINALIADYTALQKNRPGDERLKGVSFAGGQPSGGQFDDDLQRVNDKYADKSSARKGSESDFQRVNKQLTERIAALTAAATAESKLTDAQRYTAQLQATIAAGNIKLTATEREQLTVRLQALRVADEAVQQQTLFAETQRAYQQLRDELRTPIEVAVETAQARIETLNKALKQGSLDADQYQQDISRIARSGFDTAPEFGGLSVEVGGVDSEQFRLDQARQELEDWRSEQLQLLNQYRADKIGAESQWNQQELLIEQQHQAALAGLQQAQSQLLMTQATSTFSSMAEIARNAAGEQSKAYQALFAVSKGFAVAQAAVSLATNMAKASELGWPANIVAIAAAAAQGAQIAQLLTSAQYATGGHVTGPGTGTSDSIPAWLSNDEFVTRSAVVRQSGALRFLEDFNARGMVALDDWSQRRRVRHATGGLAGVPAPAMAAPNLASIAPAEQPAGNQTKVNNRMRVYVLNNEDELVQRLANHPAMEKAVVAHAGRNGTTIQAEW